MIAIIASWGTEGEHDKPDSKVLAMGYVETLGHIILKH